MTNLKLLAVALVSLALTGSAIAAPQLTIKESIFNFGYVPQNSKVTTSFWLYSTGDDSLKILRVVPGWGCTKAPLKQSEIAVGDSTELEIIFSSKTARSRVSKRPRIETNEGKPHKFVQIIADVVRRPDSTYPIVFKPYKLDISQFGEKVRDEMTFTIRNVSDTMDVRITLIRAPNDLIELKLPDKVKAGETAKAVLKLKKEAIGKKFETSFTIELDDRAKTRYTIPIKRSLQIPGKVTAAKTTGK